MTMPIPAMTRPCLAFVARIRPCGRLSALARRGPAPRLQSGNDVRGDGRAGVALDLAQLRALGVRRQRHGDAARAGAAGAPDAVHVVARLSRQVEIDDVADAGDV